MRRSVPSALSLAGEFSTARAGWLLPLLAAAILLPPSGARADFALGNAADFTVYGFGAGTNLQLSPGAVTVEGNVGVGQGGAAETGGAGVDVTGQIIYADPITTSNFTPAGTNESIDGSILQGSTTQARITNGLASGQLVQNSAVALGAQNDLVALYNSVEGLSATTGSPTGSLASSFTWTGNGGTNVARISSFNYGSGDTLTIKGTSSDLFVIDISGGWSMGAGAKIVLDGVDSDQVLFNMLKTADGGSGRSVGANGNMVGSGILLALNRDVTIHTTNGSWTGRIFSDEGKSIRLFSGATINLPTTTANPEPTSIALFAVGFIGLATHRGLKRRRAGC